jgi:hypothetical protein
MMYMYVLQNFFSDVLVTLRNSNLFSQTKASFYPNNNYVPTYITYVDIHKIGKHPFRTNIFEQKSRRTEK